MFSDVWYCFGEGKKGLGNFASGAVLSRDSWRCFSLPETCQQWCAGGGVIRLSVGCAVFPPVVFTGEVLVRRRTGFFGSVISPARGLRLVPLICVVCF